ncbi:nitric oxide reductase transcriptional regulator NorR [Roseateles amylovorans]|uniref:Nitric oxide reductase transcriptional regulator NorR n=1 Tax=Roseateles amylovorans TaxID=2978473 RepID=A0ABY6B1G0_9BURK|nr:nitric oxide reductase transcriptional regulator NorR [Roseateles amylovorans]UXH78388.1 nitric oxide reductase transcriptional regulator NorR [Roseateles amylovorans]
MVTLTTEAPYGEWLSAVRSLVACDAVALLRLLPEPAGEAVLQPVAVDGLAEEALGRRFSAAAHPRLARLLASGPCGLRFSADAGLPDPYDGLLDGQQELKAVHDCMGVPLRCEGQLWGLVTLDALDPHAFDAIEPARRQAIARLLEAGIAAQHTIQALADHAAQAQAVAQAQWQSGRPRELLGKSAAMMQLKREIDTVAGSDLTVLILGETGVGKELVAQRLHARSARQARPLVQINCAALPETLADSELFGHKRGAFTGAVADRVGKFELADGGTLFLDEVGELPLSVQAKLLRVLQSGELQRPGSDRLQRVDVRVLAATNRDLGQEVARGRFRADLYHRLSVFPLQVPALRERGRDVLTLAGGFLEENQHRLGARNLRLEPAASAALLTQRWPGNVRELEHLISRAALRAWSEPSRGGRWTAIELRHLGLEAREATGVGALAAPVSSAALPALTPGQGLREATEAFQRQWIEAAMSRHGGSLAAAARDAGMDRSNLLRLAKRLGVRPAAVD